MSDLNEAENLSKAPDNRMENGSVHNSLTDTRTSESPVVLCKDEKICQPVEDYEEERPMNLVKKIKLDTSSSPDVTGYSMQPRDEEMKENLPDDAPMDLSSGTKRTDTKLSRKSAIDRLREELSNEETTLLLLKKLQRSQLAHRSHDAIKQTDHSVFKLPVHSTPNRPVPVPPPLVRGPQAPSINHHSHMIQHRTELPRVSVYGQATSLHHMTTVRGPPPMISAPRPSVVRPLNMTPEPTSAPPPRPVATGPTPEQTLAQSKDAAKLALRRQLEATLLQIPPPKPAALAVNFIPSIGSNVEFVSLLGLEEVVSCIANQEASEAGGPNSNEDRKPFQCAHCQTDFTPVWRRSQTAVDEILCEKCAITAQKRMLKQEHTARLKAAFMHALQQEREIEASGGLTTSAAAALSTARTAPIVTDPKIYSGLGQHARSVPSFHTLTDPRMLPVSAPYGLIAGPPRQQFGAFSHRSDHQLVKRMT